MENDRWEGTATELLEDLGLTGQITPNRFTRILNLSANELYEQYKVCYYPFRKDGKRMIKLVDDSVGR